jgi:hypothetical protein
VIAVDKPKEPKGWGCQHNYQTHLIVSLCNRCVRLVCLGASTNFDL